MEIKLTRDLPVESKHKCSKGKKFHVLREQPAEGRIRPKGYWIEGAVGEEVLAFATECEEVNET